MNQDEFEHRIHEIHERVLSKALSPEEENNYTESLFESIRHTNEYGQEYWYARELQDALEYSKWRNFFKVIEKAICTCENSSNIASDHLIMFFLMVSEVN